MDDAELNRQFARAFWNCPIDERNNTYWHDDDKTPVDENHEWKPLPDFCNNWSEVRKVLVKSKTIVPPDFIKRSARDRNRHTMAYLISNGQETHV